MSVFIFQNGTGSWQTLQAMDSIGCRERWKKEKDGNSPTNCNHHFRSSSSKYHVTFVWKKYHYPSENITIDLFKSRISVLILKAWLMKHSKINGITYSLLPQVGSIATLQLSHKIKRDWLGKETLHLSLISSPYKNIKNNRYWIMHFCLVYLI